MHRMNGIVALFLAPDTALKELERARWTSRLALPGAGIHFVLSIGIVFAMLTRLLKRNDPAKRSLSLIVTGFTLPGYHHVLLKQIASFPTSIH
jgi:hypothetical protein